MKKIWFPKRRSCQSQLAIPEVFLGIIRVPLGGYTWCHLSHKKVCVSKALRCVNQRKLARKQNTGIPVRELALRPRKRCVSGSASNSLRPCEMKDLLHLKQFGGLQCYNPICQEFHHRKIEQWAMILKDPGSSVVQRRVSGGVALLRLMKISVAWFMLAWPWPLFSTWFLPTKYKIYWSTWYMLIHANLRVPPQCPPPKK